MKSYETYKELIKPSFAPPSYLFGPVWTVLYFIIFVSFGLVFVKVFKGQLPKFVALPFALNLFFNFSFTPLQFGLKNNLLASVDILLVLLTIIWSMVSIWPYIKGVAYAQVPYLLWVSFATMVQLSITYLNWK